MNDKILWWIAAAVCACLYGAATLKTLGAMQQSGYKNGVFARWLGRKDNMYYNRLCVLTLCLALSSAVVALCFSFLGTRGALLLSALPFWGFLLWFVYADSKYALKVQIKRTGRLVRLFIVYLLLMTAAAFLYVWLLSSVAEINGSSLYALFAYFPFALFTLFTPLLLMFANAITSIFENCRNAKFVKRAGQVLDETKIIRVAIVGSYGKTSVKNILKTILSEDYATVATPESYNTPVGIAKTVYSAEFSGKEVLIAEMGARRRGDIAELCRLVKPDYAIFTGVCEQHIQTFGSLEEIFAEKKTIVEGTKGVIVCGGALRADLIKAYPEEHRLCFVGESAVKDLSLGAMQTAFTLVLDGEEIPVKTPLLGKAAVENIALAATLAQKMGLSATAIAEGIAKVQPIPHRLQLIESGGAYILDDGYNGNPRGAKEGIAALKRFDGRKCIVTPGLVECGVLEEKLNEELGEEMAKADLDKVILVGDTLIGAVKTGYTQANGDDKKLIIVPTLDKAQELLAEWVGAGDAVLFLNDLPDVY